MGVVINLDRWLYQNNEYALPLARFKCAVEKTADVWKKMFLTLITPFAIIVLAAYALLGKLINCNLQLNTKQEQLVYMMKHILQSFLPMHHDEEEIEFSIRSSTQAVTLNGPNWKEVLEKTMNGEESRGVVEVSSQRGEKRRVNAGVCGFFDALSEQERSFVEDVPPMQL